MQVSTHDGVEGNHTVKSVKSVTSVSGEAAALFPQPCPHLPEDTSHCIVYLQSAWPPDKQLILHFTEETATQATHH